MAKRELSSKGLDAILGDFKPAAGTEEAAGAARVHDEPREEVPAAESRRRGRPKGSGAGPARRTTTVRITEDDYRRMGVVCYYARMTHQEFMDIAIARVIESFEKTHGPIREGESAESLAAAGVRF